MWYIAEGLSTFDPFSLQEMMKITKDISFIWRA